MLIRPSWYSTQGQTTRARARLGDWGVRSSSDVPFPLLFQRYESVMFAGLDFRGEVAECMAAAESHKPARTSIALDWPLHSGAARSIVPVEPEIIIKFRPVRLTRFRT